MKIVITSDEIFAMRNAGCSRLARLVYYEAIRPHMDFTTGIVGRSRKISMRSISEDVYVEPSAGRHTDIAGAPSKKQIRTAIDGLMNAGLLEKIGNKGEWMAALIFFLPKAYNGRVCPKEDRHEDRHEDGHEDKDRMGTRMGTRTIVTTYGFTTDFSYNVANDWHEDGHEDKDRMGTRIGTRMGTHLGVTGSIQREGKGETPLQTPLAGAPECAHVAASMPETASIELEPTPTAKKPRATKAKASLIDQPALALPDWIDPKTWHDYEAHRKGLRKPLVNGSTTHVLRDLEKLRTQGHDPNAVLSQSIVRGWVGVFPLAGEHPCQTFVPGNRTAKPGGIDLGPSGRSTRDAAERWLNNSNSIENAQENPES